jgi:phosphoribosylformimino-5-aminoimidazole carboxamide ribotide isomerase
MIILPAIDILDGKAVRLFQGDYNTAEKVAGDPFEAAKSFEEAGAEHLHLVDLSGARSGSAEAIKLISKIASSVKMKTEVGGGIRSLETVRAYLEGGVDRVILGTAAINDKKMLTEAVSLYGDRIIVGIDARGGKVSVSGWTDDSDVDYIDMARECEQIGVKNIIFTDISRDGSLKGPNFDMLKSLSESVSCDITASGGIKSIEDIVKLREMNLYGAICGKSLYSGTLSLTEALLKAR